MKKKFLLLYLVPLILSGCKSPYSIEVEKDDSLTTFVSLSSDEIESFISSSKTFAILFSNAGSCSSCRAAETNVSNYVNSTKKKIYQYTYQVLNDPVEIKYPDIFPKPYPSLFLIKEGKKIYNIDSDSMQEKSRFEKVANQHIF